ncbi:MAG: phosphoheptose isomerase [Gammaproteobacteria bacterium]|nr:phosphoheptose isomerase [Gammaproteobacteria bacterium]
MNKIEQVTVDFKASIQAKTSAMEVMPEKIAQAAEIIIEALKQGNKVLSCGNGGSACDAMHFAAELLNRFIKERQSLPAIALSADTATITAIGNDYSYADIFAKQISSLGQANDILLAISTSGNSKNIVRAVEIAQKRGLVVVALTGNDGGELAKMLTSNKDIELRVPSTSTPRIQELHLLIIHCLCGLIDAAY